MYLASDSRLSWGNKGYWDLGRKIFPSEKYGDILGYCGEALFCSQQLSQIVTFIDSCSSFEEKTNPKERSEMIFGLIRDSFGPYPKSFCLPSFSIFYLTRRQKYDFCAFNIKWSLDNGWAMDELPVGNSSSLIAVDGSGSAGYKSLHKAEVETSDFGRHSRGYFYALHRYISGDIDPATGGPPQISCIYNVGAAIKLGTIYKEERYIYGLHIPEGKNLNNVRWVNETLENCDGILLERLDTAQPQPIPSKLSGK